MKTLLSVVYCLLFTVVFLRPVQSNAQNDYTNYVNPFIGTGGHGHTFPGATVPFGMVQVSPDTRIDGSWDGCGGYHYSDSVIYGFSHTHLSGTGVSDYGDILLMPVRGNPSLDNKSYSSKFSHSNENASAGFYSVKLDDENITVELTATKRTGFHRYSFPKAGTVSVVLDLLHRDRLLEGKIRMVNKTTLEGVRRSEAWARDQHVYYRIEFSKPIIDSHFEKKDTNDAKAWFKFNLAANEKLLVKVAISGVNEEGAGKNMTAEIPHWDFERVKKEAHDAWQKELSKIEVSGGTDEQMKIFYSALYHCFLQPNIYNDVDGHYRGRDLKIHKADGFDYYTVFSLWDTFRAWHPLMTIIDKKRTLDFIKTFLAQYEQGGLLPVWELSSNETECMIGYHSVSVIADAAVKGITGFDMEKAFEAMKKSAESRDRFGLREYIDKGCLSLEDENESVSKTLEYAYDDWCIAQMAQLLKKEKDYQYYMERSQYWKNLYDPKTGFIRPRKNGGWLEPFDPYEVNNNYTEANAWQYTFFVPHEIQSMIEIAGGPEKFEKKLDDLFSAEDKTTGREQADITGMIGQYAHGNEPSHHMAYLYNYIGKPNKTNQRVRQILNDYYHAAPDGLIGNEDCGQMSAWYVMSAMGLYQVCPGRLYFDVVKPLFPNIVLNLENGTSLPVDSNLYFQYYFASIVFNRDIHSLPRANLSLRGKPITSNPIILSSSSTFKDKTTVAIESVTPQNKLAYTLDGSMPTGLSSTFNQQSSISIDTTTTIKAIAINNKGETSKVVIANFYKMLHPDWEIHIQSKYTPQYSAGGNDGIIDGLRGDEDWRKGGWQGYQGQDFECVIDMQKEQKVNRVGAGFLQDTRAWILMPKQAEFSFSSDSVHFSEPVIIKNTVEDKDMNVRVKDFTETISPRTARYVKVKAANYGKLPEWHQGYPYNGDAYIFVDEILIN